MIFFCISLVVLLELTSVANIATRGTMSGYFVPATLQAATTLDVMAILATCFGGYSPSWQPENTDTLRNDMDVTQHGL